jgi:hypothetical protein
VTGQELLRECRHRTATRTSGVNPPVRQLRHLVRGNWETGSLIPKSLESRSVGSKIKQGFVELPLAEVTLEESEMIQQCAMRVCEKWETTETVPRFQRCSKCKRRYYVRTEYDLKPVPFHLIDDSSGCAVLDRGKFAPFALRLRPLCITNTLVPISTNTRTGRLTKLIAKIWSRCASPTSRTADGRVRIPSLQRNLPPPPPTTTAARRRTWRCRNKAPDARILSRGAA